MTAEPNPPKVTSEIGGIRAADNIAPIEATYYTLSDRDGRGQGGLVVLLDSAARPVRAELHIYEDIEVPAREQLARQALLVLKQRYYGRQAVPLRVYDSLLDAHPIEVELPTEPPSGVKPRRKPAGRSPWLWALLALIPIVLLLWLGFTFLGGGGDEAATTDTAVESTDGAAATDGEGAGAATAPTPAAEQLPPSVNARSDIAPGMRVRIVPGLSAYLLDQPDAVNGAQIGIVSDGQEMTVSEGPVMRRGTSDTIVWWYVVTDDGGAGWAPANTSELTLLEPVGP